MRAAFLPFRATIFGLGIAGLGATCCAAPPRTPVGVSDAVEVEHVVEAAAPKRAVWPDFASAQAWPEAAPAVVALGHRRDGTLIRVRVEPSALSAYRALATDAPMPDGARVAAFHETPAGELLGTYLLEKRSGVWTATELDARGAQTLADPTPCLRCHDLAPTDHLFGVVSRAPATASPSGT